MWQRCPNSPGGAAISLFIAGDHGVGRAGPGQPGHRPVRLVVLLVALLAALCVLRVIVVLVVNNQRLPEERLEGVAISGRYYPVEKVCKTVDSDELEEGLAGHRLDRGGYGLLAAGNGFEVVADQGEVSIDCVWQNWEFDTDPQVSILFSAQIHADRIEPQPDCRSMRIEREAEVLTLGPYRACREFDGFEAAYRVVDDNATVGCSVKSRVEELLPALEAAVRSQCVRFVDRLARSRPITFWGSGFLTVR